MRKNLTIVITVLIFSNCVLQSQTEDKPGNTSGIIDIASYQLYLWNKYKDLPVGRMNTLMIDSIYKPYADLWKGLLGSVTAFNMISTMANKEFLYYNEKAKTFNIKELNDYYIKIKDSMMEFTGHQPIGECYVLFGPQFNTLSVFTNDGTMIIDLACDDIKNIDYIIYRFPHEINHQICVSTNEYLDRTILWRALHEGFACYVSYLFHKRKRTIANELGYTEEGYLKCREKDKEVLMLLKENYKSTDEELKFFAKDFKFSKDYPGAIGYYIGFRIVEEYIRRNGKNSWKDIYTMKPEEVLKKSKILE